MRAWTKPLALSASAMFAVAAANAAPVVTANSRLLGWLPRLAGEGVGPTAALTFDDGPDPRSTPQILDELDRLGWRATFFLLGEMQLAAPELAREILARGHEVGVHGMWHRSHPLRLPTAVRMDMRRAVAIHEDTLQVRPRWFRPPYGSLSVGTLLAARSLRLQTVLWTVAGRDWRAEATARTVAEDVRRGLREGATVLLHDSDCTSAPGSWRATLEALPILADAVAASGLRVVTLSEHLVR
jgi:peptidoglycan/xylan/chitin deacetylase (PgdA/CDA1 family)